MKFREYIEEERGKGMGVGGEKQKDGGSNICKCPKCGEEVTHKKGVPCKENKCPKCNTLMQGKSK